MVQQTLEVLQDQLHQELQHIEVQVVEPEVVAHITLALEAINRIEVLHLEVAVTDRLAVEVQVQEVVAPEAQEVLQGRRQEVQDLQAEADHQAEGDNKLQIRLYSKL